MLRKKGVFYMLVFNCYQIINKVGEGIAATNGAWHLGEGACDLHRQMWIKKKRASEKAVSRHPALFSDTLLIIVRHPTLFLDTLLISIGHPTLFSDTLLIIVKHPSVPR